MNGDIDRKLQAQALGFVNFVERLRGVQVA
jgi:hypothetical protein